MRCASRRDGYPRPERLLRRNADGACRDRLEPHARPPVDRGHAQPAGLAARAAAAEIAAEVEDSKLRQAVARAVAAGLAAREAKPSDRRF